MNLNIISFAIEAHDKVNHKYDGKPYSVHLALVAYYCQKYIDAILDSALIMRDNSADHITYTGVNADSDEEVRAAAINQAEQERTSGD